MHELSIAQSIIDSIQQQKTEQNFKEVKTLSLEIGKLSCIEPESLAWYLHEIGNTNDNSNNNNPLQNTKIEINHKIGHATCNQCGKHFEIDEIYHCCPECDAYDTTITDGKEMKINSLEVI